MWMWKSLKIYVEAHQLILPWYSFSATSSGNISAGISWSNPSKVTPRSPAKRKREKKNNERNITWAKVSERLRIGNDEKIPCTCAVALSILLDFFISSFRASIVRSHFWRRDQKVIGYFHYRFALNLSAKPVGYIWRQIARGNAKRLAHRLKQNEYSIQVLQAENYHFSFLGWDAINIWFPDVFLDGVPVKKSVFQPQIFIAFCNKKNKKTKNAMWCYFITSYISAY